MYMPVQRVDIPPTANMTDDSLNTTMLGSIPKRIPYDSSEWFKTFGRQLDHLGRHNVNEYYNDDMYFYLIASVITLVFMVALLIVYCFCCVWVMKGNLDLPQPGVDQQKKTKFCVRNPLPSFMKLFSRYDIDKNTNGRNATDPTNPQATSHKQLQPSEPETITTISNNAEQRRSSYSKMFENKASNLCDSYKQFQQFRYDLHDDEPEDVVFDLYDLQK